MQTSPRNPDVDDERRAAFSSRSFNASMGHPSMGRDFSSTPVAA